MDILFTCCKSLFTGLRGDVVCMVDTYLWYFEIWNAYSLSHFYPQHFMRCKQLRQHIWVYNKYYKTIQEVLYHCLNHTKWSLSSHLQCVHVLWNCCQVKWTKKKTDRTREIYSENVWTATLKVSIESSEEHRHYPKLPGWTLLLQFGLQREKKKFFIVYSFCLFGVISKTKRKSSKMDIKHRYT